MDPQDHSLAFVVSAIEKLESGISRRFDDLKQEINRTDERQEKAQECLDARVREVEATQGAHSLALKIIGVVSSATFGALIPILIKYLGART